MKKYNQEVFKRLKALERVTKPMRVHSVITNVSPEILMGEGYGWVGDAETKPKVEKTCFGCKHLVVVDMDGDCWCKLARKDIPDPVVLCDGNKRCSCYAE